MDRLWLPEALSDSSQGPLTLYLPSGEVRRENANTESQKGMPISSSQPPVLIRTENSNQRGLKLGRGQSQGDSIRVAQESPRVTLGGGEGVWLDSAELPSRDTCCEKGQ